MSERKSIIREKSFGFAVHVIKLYQYLTESTKRVYNE